MVGLPKRKTGKEILIIIFFCIGQVFTCWAGLTILSALPPDWPASIGILGGLLMAAPIIGFCVYLSRRYSPKTLPSRVKPMTKIRSELIPWVILLAFFNGLMLIDPFVAHFFTHDLDEFDLKLLMLIVLVGNVIGVLLFFSDIIIKIKNNRVLARSPGNAVGTILGLQIFESQSYDEGISLPSYSYQFTLEFTPKLARNTQEKLVLIGYVNRKLWDRLMVGQKINILYAIENPRIFLLEGE